MCPILTFLKNIFHTSTFERLSLRQSARYTTMFRTKYTIIVSFLICFFGMAEAQNAGEWALKNEKEGVKVYYRKTSDVYELKLVTSIQSSVSGLIKLLSEVEHYPQWGYKVAESALLYQTSRTESVYYSKLDFPWPLDDRDIVMRNHVVQDPVSGKVTATSISVPDFIPKKNGVTRIRNANTTWEITPGKGGWLYVEYRIYSDPGGSLPDWLINMAIDIGPRETMNNIRAFVKQPTYQTAKLAHIRE